MQYIEDITAKQQWPGSLQENNPGNIVFKFSTKTGFDFLKGGLQRDGFYINQSTGDNLPITIPGTIVPGGFQLEFQKR